MRISHFVIQNFRKLACCRIELHEKETLFVGANNSGKTSAMDALILFLKRSSKQNIKTTDFTLSNWSAINQIGKDWVTASEGAMPFDLESFKSRWDPFLPSLDVWISIAKTEVHYASHLLPTLDWDGGLLGVRLVFEPRDIEEFYKNFIEAHSVATSTVSARQDRSGPSTFSLWPRSLRDFLEKKLEENFKINAYILDPLKAHEGKPQQLPHGSLPLEEDPFSGLFKIDIINAQRGFSDPNGEDDLASQDRRLSSQLRKYYDKHLDPTDMPEADDLEALEAIETARTAFDKKMRISFESPLSELEGLNYPGFSNPTIQLSSKVKPLDGLNHDSAVLFAINNPSTAGTGEALTLPEKYNGLGYQNLISMVFKLIRFRDEWMRVKKAKKRGSGSDTIIEPLHLVLVEEPEAHLHAQVQQVFIKKAYGVLRNHTTLGENSQLRTQLILSTHSSHIAHEIDFTSLRYFKRKPAASLDHVPCSTVANLSSIFGGASETSQFATRYLKATHCDLFFADAAILVEGPAERMLIPHFIRSKFADLDVAYLTILEIGGSHAHRLRPLIDALELVTLIVTDLDPIEKDSYAKTRPRKGCGFRTRNSVIKEWVPGLTDLDEVLGTNIDDRISSDGNVCVAYQRALKVVFNSKKSGEAIPYTFEDALVLGNLSFFKEQNKSTGLIKKMYEATQEATIDAACEKMYDALKGGDKAEMALDLLCTEEADNLVAPEYIEEGLEWLQNKLKVKAQEFPQPEKASKSN